MPRPSAGRPLVPVLARPAADFSVTGPDAAQNTAPSMPPTPTGRTLRPACYGPLPVPGAPIGAGFLTSVPLVCSGSAGRGTFSTGMLGRSIIPVRSVNGTRRTRGVLR
jgi:hypothetical protein